MDGASFRLSNGLKLDGHVRAEQAFNIANQCFAVYIADNNQSISPGSDLSI